MEEGETERSGDQPLHGEKGHHTSQERAHCGEPEHFHLHHQGSERRRHLAEPWPANSATTPSGDRPIVAAIAVTQACEPEEWRQDRWSRGGLTADGGSPHAAVLRSASPVPGQLTAARSAGLLSTTPQDGESDTEVSLLLNRTRQKKFVKNFKQLPSEELVLQRYSCALVGDILLQGHLYVTENYVAFHSNVFGYVTRIQIPMTSVISITKEKTAKIIPNAVGVSTSEETHMFSSLISREATFKVLTKAWRKALARENLPVQNGVSGHHSGPDILEFDVFGAEDEPEEEELDQVDGESTDSMVSANKTTSATFSSVTPETADVAANSPFIKRMSNASGTIYYQARSPPPPTAANGDELMALRGGRRAGGVGGLPTQFILLSGLSLLLAILLCSSLYLILRLDDIQERVESVLTLTPSSFEQIATWQRVLHTQSSRKVQEYLDSNLEQIAKVRENLERLSSILYTTEGTGEGTGDGTPSAT